MTLDGQIVCKDPPQCFPGRYNLHELLLQGVTTNFAGHVFLWLLRYASRYLLEILCSNSSDLYLITILRKSFILSVLSSTQLVKLIGLKYACAQWISNLSYYWAWLVKLDFFSFPCQFGKITTLSSLFWQLQALLEQFKFM